MRGVALFERFTATSALVTRQRRRQRRRLRPQDNGDHSGTNDRRSDTNKTRLATRPTVGNDNFNNTAYMTKLQMQFHENQRTTMQHGLMLLSSDE